MLFRRRGSGGDLVDILISLSLVRFGGIWVHIAFRGLPRLVAGHYSENLRLCSC